MNLGGENKDVGLDKLAKTAQYGGEEEKIKYYKDGVPEEIGRKTVDKLFEGESENCCTVSIGP